MEIDKLQVARYHISNHKIRNATSWAVFLLRLRQLLTCFYNTHFENFTLQHFQFLNVFYFSFYDCPRSDDGIVSVSVFFSLDNRSKTTAFQGHTSKVKVTCVFDAFSCVILRLPAGSTLPWVRHGDLILILTLLLRIFGATTSLTNDTMNVARTSNAA